MSRTAARTIPNKEKSMLHVNENYARIKPTYLFAEIAHRVSAHMEANPGAKVIRLGIGDVTEPLCPAVVEAMQIGRASCRERV